MKINALSFCHLIIPVVGALLCLAGCTVQRSRDKIDQEQGALLEKAGALSQQDYVKPRQLMNGAESAPIPEKDIAWACSLLNGRRVNDKGGPQLYMSVASVLVRNDGPAPINFRQHYLDIGREMVGYHDTRSPVVELGIIMLAKSRNKAAADLVRPFLTTPDVQETASKAMKVLQ